MAEAHPLTECYRQLNELYIYLSADCKNIINTNPFVPNLKFGTNINHAGALAELTLNQYDMLSQLITDGTCRQYDYSYRQAPDEKDLINDCYNEDMNTLNECSQQFYAYKEAHDSEYSE